MDFPKVYLGHFYDEYDFVNIKNKNVTKAPSRWVSPKLKLKNIDFSFGFYEDYAKRENEGKSNSYWYWKPSIYIYAPKDKYIDQILINKVTVYADGTEYSMLERVRSVHLRLTLVYNDTRYIQLNKEEIADVQRTGIINRFINPDNENTPINTENIDVGFSSVPIDSKCKEVRILYDITVKYTTGEEIIINQKITGLKKKKLFFEGLPWWVFFFATV
jgi:hypothetical protein